MEGGHQLCTKLTGPPEVIKSGGWPGSGVWECESDRDWGRGSASGHSEDRDLQLGSEK